MAALVQRTQSRCTEPQQGEHELQKVFLQPMHARGRIPGKGARLGEVAGVHGDGIDMREVVVLVVADCQLRPEMVSSAILTFCMYRFSAYIHVVMTSLEVAYLW